MANQKISAMNKITSLTKAMKIPLGELESGVGNFATDPLQISALIFPRVTADTSGDTITLNMDDMPGVVFVGSASFSTAKTLAVSNPTNAREFKFLFQIGSVAGTLDLSSFIANDPRISSGIWTSLDTGRFILHAIFDGSIWWIKDIKGPYA